jgi:Tfp pilus assembly protein PilX
MTKTERGFTGNQRGVAFLTVMLLLLILTVIGVAAVTVSGLEAKRHPARPNHVWGRR